jgi:hypothetical protein
VLSFVILGLVLATFHAAEPGAGTSEARPQAFLTWHAPYGMPGASDRLVTTCDDTLTVDTMFVSFRTYQNRPAVLAMSTSLLFHPAEGDTLGPFWHFKRGWENEGNLLIDFDRVAIPVVETAWDAMGVGHVTYDHRSGRGRLDFEFRLPTENRKPLIGGNTYVCARVRIRHRRPTLGGCGQPVCIELTGLQLKLATSREIEIDPSGHRFIGWNSPDGRVCQARSRLATQRPWRPKL